MIFRTQPSDCLRNLIGNPLDEPGLGVCSPSIVDLQPLAMRRHRCPDVLVSQPLSDLPPLSHESDLAGGIDPPDEVNLASADWQLFWDLLALRFGQSLCSDLPAGLCWCQASERRRMIFVHVPREKLPALAQDFIEAVETATIPETLRPQAVETFDQRVALGLCGRDEERLDAEVQTEPDKGTEAARGFISASGGRVIVKLKEMWQAQGLPCLQDMEAQAAGALVSAVGFAQGMSPCINGMKDEEFLTTSEVASSPVHEMFDYPACQLRRRVIELLRRGWSGLDEPGGFEPPVDSGKRRERLEQTMAGYFLLDGSCTDQPNLTTFKCLADAQDHLAGERVESRGRVMGSS